MVYDNLSNAIANIKQASKRKQAVIIVYNTIFIQNILYLLIKLGFIYSFHILNSRNIHVFLKYDICNKAAISNIQRVSRPGSRVYMSYKVLKEFSKNNNVNNTYQVAIFSTSRGLLTTQMALSYKVGGELLFVIS
jgi:small subunit ribosomal protein S8